MIGAVLVPGAAAPKLVTRDMLKSMKRGAVIVDERPDLRLGRVGIGGVHHVAGDHHGQGIGRRLLTALIDRADRRGIHVMVAGIDAENHASIAFHQGLGFTEVARMKVAQSQTHAHPVLSGNRLFIKDQDAVTAYTVQ